MSEEYQDSTPDFRTQQQKVFDELLAQARKADRLDREAMEQFEALVKQPGWRTYQEMLNQRLQALSEALMQPAGSVDGMVALEYVKGAMGGLIIARDLPSVTISSLKTSLPPAKDDEEE